MQLHMRVQNPIIQSAQTEPNSELLQTSCTSWHTKEADSHNGVLKNVLKIFGCKINTIRVAEASNLVPQMIDMGTNFVWVGPYCGPTTAGGVRNSPLKFANDCHSQLLHFTVELLVLLLV